MVSIVLFCVADIFIFKVKPLDKTASIENRLNFMMIYDL